MNAGAIGKKTIKGVDFTINFMFLTIIILLLAFSGYALWDSKQIYDKADKTNYAIYKPSVEDEGQSFQELHDLSPEVLAWLCVYGTNIDYPVTQGKDNMKYINTSAEGTYSMSGAIFLDYGNSKDFSDFNSILYGHHMEQKKMFGDIGSFSSKEVFDERRYGNLYYGGADHGVEFFAFLHTDAYDSILFSPNLKEEERRQKFLDSIFAKASHKRDIKVTTKDNIILLSTCSASSTNGRDILVGKITKKTYDDPFAPKADPIVKKETQHVDSVENFNFMRDFDPSALWLVLAAASAMALRSAFNSAIEKRQEKLLESTKKNKARPRI